MISNLAVVETNEIGTGVRIAEFAIVRQGVRLGNNVTIHPNAVIEPGVIIGEGAEVFPGAYIGKEPSGAGLLLRPFTFERRIMIGPGASIGPHAVIYYDVEIGAHTLIGDGVSIREQSRIGSDTIIGRYVTVSYAVRVGNHVRVLDHSWLAGKMVIEDYVYISGHVSTTNDSAIGRKSFEEEEMRGPIIEEGAAIGASAVLLPGVVVGRSATVAAGAVVTKNVEAGSVVMGIPAQRVDRVQKNWSHTVEPSATKPHEH